MKIFFSASVSVRKINFIIFHSNMYRYLTKMFRIMSSKNTFILFFGTYSHENMKCFYFVLFFNIQIQTIKFKNLIFLVNKLFFKIKLQNAALSKINKCYDKNCYKNLYM